MANKSESIEGIILHCPPCNSSKVINITEEPTKARVCMSCGEFMKIERPTTIELTSTKKNSVGDLKVGIEVDVSDALKGLKAVQREAKKTARILKEVEERRDIKDLSDDELLEEFRSRGWTVRDSTFHAGDFEEPLYRQVEMHKNNEKQEE